MVPVYNDLYFFLNPTRVAYQNKCLSNSLQLVTTLLVHIFIIPHLNNNNFWLKQLEHGFVMEIPVIIISA